MGTSSHDRRASADGRFRKVEPFFLARFKDHPEVAPAAFTPEEDETFLAFGWHAPAELPALDHLEPPDLLQAVTALLSARPS